MSRTDNTMPRRIQEADRPEWMPRLHVGGSYARIGEDARYEEKSARQRARLALARGEEPEPARHRHNAKWLYW